MGSYSWPVAEYSRIDCPSLASRVRILAETLIWCIGILVSRTMLVRISEPNDQCNPTLSTDVVPSNKKSITAAPCMREQEILELGQGVT